MSAFPSVAIVILNWNNVTDTLACLESVSYLDYPNYVTLVVDNGSTDDSVERIRRDYPAVEILETGENLGYAAGNNTGIGYVLQKGVDYIFVLNNDTLVEARLLQTLVQFAEAHPQAGIVGPTMYCTEPTDTLYAAGSFINWHKGQTWNRGIYQPAAQFDDLQQPEEVDFITGCGVLVRKRTVETIGGLDPIYFLNYEDVEWCERARRHGFEVWFVPQAFMWHKDSATFQQGSPAHTYYLTRNALLFFSQNAPRRWRWLIVLRLILGIVRTIGAWSFKSKYRTELYRRKRTASLFALRDFFLKRFYKMGPDVARVCYLNN